MMSTKIRIFIVLVSSVLFNVYSQNDSLKIEQLYEIGSREKFINHQKSKRHFEKAVSIIDSLVENNKINSNYFLLKKTRMLDRLGYYYRKERDNVLSLKALQESLKIKNKIKEKYSLCDTYHNLGRLYVHKLDSVKAKEYYVKGLNVARDHKNAEGVVNILNAFTAYYLKFDNPKKAKEYYEEAYIFADSIGYVRGKVLALFNQSSYERHFKRYNNVIALSKKGLELSKSINYTIGIERCYKSLGYAYRKLNQPKQAIYYYEKSLALVEKLGVTGLLANRYLSLSNAYTDLKQHEIAFSYYRLYKRRQIKDLNIKKVKEFAKLDAKYIYEKQKTIDSLHLIERQKIKEVKIREEASTKFWKIITVISVLFGLLFTGIAFLLRRKKEQVKLERLQNELLQKEIEYKKKDLKHLAIDITNNKEWALVLSNQLEAVKESTGRKRANELIKLEKEIKNKIKVDESTEDFHNKIEVLSSSFYENLKKDFPSLTKNDIRLCSLIKLNMDTKQIATLQNINPSSVKMSRNRLRKKLNLTPETSLQLFLNKY